MGGIQKNQQRDYTELSVKRGPITVTSQDDDRRNSKSEEKGMKQELHVGFCNLLTKPPPPRPLTKELLPHPRWPPLGSQALSISKVANKLRTILKA